MSTENEYDVIIVGGSFAGLSAAMQLGRGRRRVLILDTGKPRNRFARAAHGFFGQDGRPPLEILEEARAQVLAYPTVEFRQIAATQAAPVDEGFLVTLENAETVRGKRLILATGLKDSLPDIPGMQELWGTGVAHCPYCHGFEVAGQPLAVFRVGPNSIHQALMLKDWSDDVTLLMHGSADLTPEEREQLAARQVKIEETPVARLCAQGADLEAVELTDGRHLPLAAVFTVPCSTLASPLAEQLGCEIEEGMLGTMVKTDDLKQSSIPGVFIAGDMGRAPHSITLACADGAMAGVCAHRSLIFS